MPPDPEIANVLERLAAAAPAGAVEPTPERLREASEWTGRVLSGEPQAVSAVFDAEMAGVGTRVYRPLGCKADASLGVLTWFHGGGWVTGSLDAFDVLCRALANAGGLAGRQRRLPPGAGASVPRAVEDAVAVTRWLLASADQIGGDRARIAVGGDSAGGNLAAVVAQRLRDAGEPPPACQALVYPVIDAAGDTDSYCECDQGYGLTAADMRRYFDLYLAGADGLDPAVSPIRAATLAGLAPAVVMTAEFDPLRDEGEAYAKALADAGVPVVAQRVDGVVHGYLRWLAVSSAARASVQQLASAVAAMLAQPSPDA